MIAVPPLEAGAVKVRLTLVAPVTVAVPITGAPGATALTVKLRVTVVAALVAELPVWSASMVQVPEVTKVRAPPEVTVHTPVVDELKLTVRPEEEEATRLGVEPKL